MTNFHFKDAPKIYCLGWKLKCTVMFNMRADSNKNTTRDAKEWPNNEGGMQNREVWEAEVKFWAWKHKRMDGASGRPQILLWSICLLHAKIVQKIHEHLGLEGREPQSKMVEHAMREQTA